MCRTCRYTSNPYGLSARNPTSSDGRRRVHPPAQALAKEDSPNLDRDRDAVFGRRRSVYSSGRQHKRLALRLCSVGGIQQLGVATDRLPSGRSRLGAAVGVRPANVGGIRYPTLADLLDSRQMDLGT